MTAGRPTIFTKELGELICSRVASHTCGIKKLCGMFDDMPAESTIYQWRHAHEEFSKEYALAKMIQADLLVEEIIDISDDSTNDTNIDRHGNETLNGEWVARSRLRVDSRKWLASKLLPKQYGDFKFIEEKMDENESLKEELRKLRDQLAEKNKREY